MEFGMKVVHEACAYVACQVAQLLNTNNNALLRLTAHFGSSRRILAVQIGGEHSIDVQRLFDVHKSFRG